MRHVAVLVVLVLTGVGLVTSPAGAKPTWQPVTNLFADLSAPGVSAHTPAVAVDGQGNATAVWTRYTGTGFAVQATTRLAGGAWSAPVDLSTGGDVRSADVVVDRAGNATAIWRREDAAGSQVEAATRPAGGTWSTPAVLGWNPKDELLVAQDHPQVAVDAAGNVTATWLRFDPPGRYVVQAAHLPVGGTWTAPSDISIPIQSARAPQVAVSPAGAALVVWADGRYGGAVHASARAADGSWSAPVSLSGAGTPGFGLVQNPQVAIAPNGDTTAVWSEFSGTNYAIRTAMRPAGAGWTAPVELSPPGEDSSWTPQVAVDADGVPTAVWERTDGTHWITVATSRGADGRWSTPEDLSAPGQGASQSQVAVSPDGDATATWLRSNGTHQIVQAAHRPRDGVWTDPVDLSAPGGHAGNPRLAIDPQGNSTTAWSRHDGTSWVAQARGLDAAGPVVTDLTSPRTGNEGEKQSYSVTAHDVWSEVESVVWDFGDGTTATGTAVTHVNTKDRTRPVKVTLTDAVGNVTLCRTTCRSVDGELPAAPVITRAKLRPQGIEISGPPRRTRTTVALRLTEDAKVTLSVKRKGAPGKAAKQKVVLRRSLDAGPSRIRLTSRLLAKKLGKRSFQPGRYAITLRAVNSAGKDERSMTLRVRR